MHEMWELDLGRQVSGRDSYYCGYGRVARVGFLGVIISRELNVTTNIGWPFVNSADISPPAFTSHQHLVLILLHCSSFPAFA